LVYFCFFSSFITVCAVYFPISALPVAFFWLFSPLFWSLVNKKTDILSTFFPFFQLLASRNHTARHPVTAFFKVFLETDEINPRAFYDVMDPPQDSSSNSTFCFILNPNHQISPFLVEIGTHVPPQPATRSSSSGSNGEDCPGSLLKNPQDFERFDLIR